MSKQKLSGILRRPERKERGIAPGTTAIMRTNKVFKKTIPLLKQNRQPAFARGFGVRRAPGEIWIMFKDTNPSTGSGQAIRKIISAWRYPGISKPGEEIPIPEDIRQELENSEELL